MLSSPFGMQMQVASTLDSLVGIVCCYMRIVHANPYAVCNLTVQQLWQYTYFPVRGGVLELPSAVLGLPALCSSCLSLNNVIAWIMLCRDSYR